MKISVNILTWNTIKTLRMTLDILRDELKDIKHEIIIVDNGSTDWTNDYVDDLPWIDSGEIKLIINDQNVGISKAKNQGIRLSKGEYIFLLDGDVVPVPNSIKKLIEFLDQNLDKKAIGFHPNRFSTEPNRHGHSHHENFCERLFDPKPVNVTCLYYGLFRREVFDVCMMDETGEFGLPGYGWEDHDFYNQMKEAGIEQYMAEMNHVAGKYYHAINSSIRRECLGYDNYMQSSQRRGKQFREKWEKCLAK